MFASALTEGFAFFIFGLRCSFISWSCDVPSSPPWSHDLPKMAASMAGSMARLLTCEKCFSYSGSCFLAGWLLDTSCSFWIYFIKDIEHYIRLECFIKGQRPLSSRVPPRVPTGLRLEPLTLPVVLFKPSDCICGFNNCKDIVAYFGVVCLLKTQPQIGDFRLKNGKYSPTF